jgi:hypothetical protein
VTEKTKDILKALRRRHPEWSLLLTPEEKVIALANIRDVESMEPRAARQTMNILLEEFPEIKGGT